MSENIELAIKIYTQRMKRDSALNYIARRHSSIKEAQKYAKAAGEHMAVAMKTAGAVTQEMTEEEIAAALQTLTKRVEVDVSAVEMAVQQTMLRKAGTGLSPLNAEHDLGPAQKVAAEFVGKEVTEDMAKNRMGSMAMKFADRILEVNAKAQEEVGLRVRITRTYDDIGLRDRTIPCEWCLSRDGDWDSYFDAYTSGAFERHDGCGCLITYEVAKTRTWSNRKGDWTDL